MITLNCTKCKTSMEMDDAFAGGVCRCQHCGTIQTVPSHLKNAGKATASSGTQRSLYSGRGGSSPAVPSSGLDDLANAVASSGLSSGLAGRAATPGQKSERTGGKSNPKTPANRMPLYVGIGVGAAVLIAVLAFVFLRNGDEAKPAVTPNNNNTPGTIIVSPVKPTGPRKSNGPHFINTPLDGNRVVFVIDRGDSNRSVFDPLKAAIYDSLESLGNDREFQVLFWTRPGTPSDQPDVNEYAYPNGNVAKANRDRIQECQKKLEDVGTSGSSEIGQAMQEAVKRKPDVIIVVTAKGISLDDRVVKQATDAVNGKSIIVHTIDLTSNGDGKSALEAIAKPTGGQYWLVTPTELRAR